MNLLGVLVGIVLGASLGADPVTVVISPDQAGAPIAKNLYGQFIEHLGKSVYGGLWAEMLDDRKFFFMVRDRFAPWGTATDPTWDSGPFDYLQGSPWKVVGLAGTVSMDTSTPYVGIHSPEVHLTGAWGGISQGELGLEAGREYRVRLVWKGDPSAEVKVRLASDQGGVVEKTLGPGTAEYTTVTLSLVAPDTSDHGRLEVVGRGSGTVEIGAVSLMPADAIHGWRADVVGLLKELDAPIYRWPGGNFVSGYDWRDGLGDPDRRPPRQNPAWRGVESNDVGLHEFLDLMALLGSEPYIALNTGLGSVASAREEVEYCVGSVDTPQGALRAAHGHPEPFPVHWWAVGNEMFGPWQLGFMPVADYSAKHNQLAQAIRAVDPQANLVGVGAVGPWDEAMLSSSAPFMDLISEHVYKKRLVDVAQHTAQLAQAIQQVADAHRRYRASIPALAHHEIPVAMDEWNYWYGAYRYGELGVQYHLRDALGVARGLHAFFRNSDLFQMANYAQTVNVLGAIKTSKTRATLDTTGLVLALYRHHFGEIPVAVEGASDTLDLSAAVSRDRKSLFLAAVNVGPEPRVLSLRVASGSWGPSAREWILSGTDPEAVNVPGEEPQTSVLERPVPGFPTVEVPGFSVVLVQMP